MLSGGYLIPANSKRGQLILNYFRMVDLIIFGVGLGVSFILLLIIGTGSLGQTIAILAPAAIGALLVAPIPNYHNVLVFITSLYTFINNRRNYIWKGWCVTNGDNKQ
ncbi:MAG: hypothetical protein E7166_05035 [Firmicutes bacterium]|nr:hypothetical protein [Bacillota bacterium]